MNNKGDIPSIFFAIATIFVIGIIFFLFSHANSSIYTRLGGVLDNIGYNNTVADTTLNNVNTFEQSMWDYAFLFIALGYALSLMLLGYFSRISNAFAIIYILTALFGLVLGAGLSNAWQTMASNPTFTDTIARFPIMNTILGAFFPLFIAVIIVTVVILLYGKFTGGEEIR